MSLFQKLESEHDAIFNNNFQSGIECARNVIHATTESTFRNIAILASFAVIDVFTFAVWFRNGIVNLIRSS